MSNKVAMPDELRFKLEKLQPMARTYAEYRAKGLKQWEAAEKAGSKASDKESLGRVGWYLENLDGIKDYILWLEEQRVSAAMIDDIEVINGLRRVVDDAMKDKKYSDANKALELLGIMAGLLGKNTKSVETATDVKGKPKNNTSAFKEDQEPSEQDSKDERIKKLHKLLQDSKTVVKV